MRDEWEGEGKWWESDEMADYDWEGMRDSYRDARSEWRDGRPTWDSWSQ